MTRNQQKEKKPFDLKNALINIVAAICLVVGIGFLAKPYVYDYMNGLKAEQTLKLSEEHNKDDIDNKRAKLAKRKGLYSGADVRSISKEDYQNSDPEKILFNYGIGQIHFMSNNQTIPVVEGVSQEALLVGAGSYKPNQQVGKGNFTLIGHRLGTTHSVLFSSLPNAKSGDKVKLTVGKKAATYVITEKKVINPQDVYVTTDEQGEGIITLICCTDDGTQRWMVRGVLA